MHKMRAKDMFFDFLDTIFLIVLILFFIFYVFIGGRLALAQQIVKTGMVLSVFILLVLINLRVERAKKEKQEADGLLEDICNYIERKDVLKDQFIIFSTSLSIPMFAAFFGGVDRIDIFQAMAVFAYMNVWHFYLFRIRDSVSQLRFVTRADEIADRVTLTFVPALILSITLFGEGANIIDFIQVLFVFGVFYMWHKHIFRSKKLL